MDTGYPSALTGHSCEVITSVMLEIVLIEPSASALLSLCNSRA